MEFDDDELEPVVVGRSAMDMEDGAEGEARPPTGKRRMAGGGILPDGFVLHQDVRQIINFGSGGVLTFLIGFGFLAAIVTFLQETGAAVDPFATPEGALFSVVVDAGSTGSRVHVFCFDSATRSLCSFGGQPEIFEQTKPGLNSCAGKQDCVSGLLRPLLDAAHSAVPEARQSATPLAVRATAGLRLLPEDQASAVMQEARSIASGYGFKDAGVEIMGGDDEGSFQWLAINHLLGTLDPLDLAPGHAVLDLGGGSVQVAYAMAPKDLTTLSAERRKTYVRDVQLPGHTTISLYQHSYLGFGLMAARARMLRQLLDEGSADSNPCFPRSGKVTYSYGTETFFGQGTGDSAGCAGVVGRLFDHSRSCGEGAGRCSFDGVWAGPGWPAQRTAITCSNFYHVLWPGGGVPQATLTAANYSERAASTCGLTAVGAHLAQPDLDAEKAQWLCFDLLYIAGLLTDGLGFGITEEVRTTSAVEHHGQRYEAAWPLGLALLGL